MLEKTGIGIKSKYLHGAACTNEIMERLGQLITDAGGNVDATFDEFRSRALEVGWELFESA